MRGGEYLRLLFRLLFFKRRVRFAGVAWSRCRRERRGEQRRGQERMSQSGGKGYWTGVQRHSGFPHVE